MDETQKQKNASLVAAIESEDPEAARRWLGEGASPDAIAESEGDWAFSVLDLAVSKKSTRLISLLLESGGAANGLGLTKGSPILGASRGGDAKITALLLDAGADPKLAVYASTKETALHWGARSGSGEVVRQLLQAGRSPDVADQSGETPLQVAAGYGMASAVAELLAAGAIPDRRGVSQRTALMWAAASGSEECVILLLAAGADARAQAADHTTAEELARICGRHELADKMSWLEKSAKEQRDLAAVAEIGKSIGLLPKGL